MAFMYLCARAAMTHGFDTAREAAVRYLREEVEVSEGESEFYRLVHLDDHSIFLVVYGGVLAHGDLSLAQVSCDAESDTFLGAGDGAGVSNHAQVPHDALELGRRHLNGAGVLLIRNAELLAIDVHQLQLELGDAVLLRRLEHEGKRVALVGGAQRDHILLPGALEQLAHVGHVEPQRHVAVAAEEIEALRAEKEGHEGHVRRVHGLQAEAGFRALQVRVGDQLIDGADHLLQQVALDESCFKHVGRKVAGGGEIERRRAAQLTSGGLDRWLQLKAKKRGKGRMKRGKSKPLKIFKVLLWHCKSK
eukprot:scaffold143_cov260-Pinguiococcus_pyrenoidosus.AAC.18